MTAAKPAVPARRPVWRLIGVVALAVLLLDRLSKLWVLEVLDLQSLGRYEVAPPYLVFLMAWNPGVNFGLLGSADMRWVLVAVAAAISLALVVAYTPIAVAAIRDRRQFGAIHPVWLFVAPLLFVEQCVEVAIFDQGWHRSFGDALFGLLSQRGS